MKLIALLCAAVLVASSSAAIERGRLGVKGGQFDGSGLDGSGKDVFGFDKSGIDKWGRPVTDASAGLIAPVGRANKSSTTSTETPTSTKTSTDSGDSKTPKKAKPTKTYPVEIPKPTPSFSAIPITWTLSSVETSSNFVQTTAIFSPAVPALQSSLKCPIKGFLVFTIDQCFAVATLDPTKGSKIISIGDFLESAYVSDAVNGEKWEFVEYLCNPDTDQASVTLQVCGATFFSPVTVIIA